ncbi:hypothetical protein WJX77_004803 [Trebouxia sp. C0004]
MPGTVFVTVGTTKFDALIQAVDTIEVAEALVKQGYTALVIQKGSGSIFEALRLGKPLVAVPNAILMDNHQAELADHLAHLRYMIAARPDTLVHTLQHLSIDGLRPYETGDAKGIITHINTLVAKKPSSKLPFIAVACLVAVLFVGVLYAGVRGMMPGRSDKYSSNV